jgi:hypothetical protein
MAVGLEVRTIARPPSAGSSSAETKAWLEGFTTERELDAMIDVLGDPTPIAVNVWILHRPSRTFRVSHVTLDTDARNAPEVLAIRTIDVLRSNFLVLDLAGRPAPAPTLDRPSEGETSRPRAEPVKLLGLEAGAAVVASLDGVGPALLPLVRLNLAVHGAFVARATFAGFGTRPSIERGSSGVRVGQYYGVAGLCYCEHSGASIGPVFALEAGLLRTSLDGWANAPNRGHDIDQLAFLLDASIGGRWQLSSRYYVELAAHAQIAAPYVAIHFVNERIAGAGNPNLLASLSVGGWL